MSFLGLFDKKTIGIFSLVGVFFAFSVLFLGTPHTVSAQVGPTNALRISVIPENPGPFETVFIDVEDFSRDLNRITVSWSVDGKKVQSGTGLKTLKLTSGPLGSVTNVSIDMSGNVQSLTIRPTATDLLWQADTFTPPFYAGKALHSNQDPITVLAMPFFMDSSGVRLDPDKLIYKWSKNGTIDDAASGYGKKSFQVFSSILLKPIEVAVNVTSVDGTFKSSASILVSDTQTEILLYENNPRLGVMFNKTLNEQNLSIADSEVRILGIPLFFSNQQKNSNLLTYNWKLNSSAVNQQGNEVVFRKPAEGGAGQSSVSLSVVNLERFTQNSSGGLNVQYNSTEVPTDNQGIF